MLYLKKFVNKGFNVKNKIRPLFLTVAIIICDQVSKLIVLKNVDPYSIGASFFNGFFRIVNIYNKGIAFSIGVGLSDNVRRFLFALIPLLVLILVLVFYFKSNDFTRIQEWAVCGIVGGGLGNLIDRFFRPQGVVDWIDFRFFGLFGFERFPTFNIADASVVVCGILLVVSLIYTLSREEKKISESKYE
ncbi:MAG: signal peptidase II [Treponema sp. CETP13]|nr:MAG: signal peptidase II [Treponema sp. CETP13]